MSKYTTQVRWIVEECTPKYENFPIKERIKIACPLIFNFDYPIYNEEKRVDLETKILSRYLMKEIGLETVGLWKFFLDERLNTIMPYYNQLYETTVRQFDYLWNVNYKEEHIYSKKENANGKITNDASSKNTSDSKTNTTSDTETKGNNLVSDTPQANYANLDYATGLSESTSTDMTADETIGKVESDNKMDSTTDTTNMILTDESYTNNKTGANGNQSLTKLLMEYRQSIINIDNLIVNELVDLFMLIY